MPGFSNDVILLGHYGGDLVHACSAWTSTARDLPKEKRKRIPQFLKLLAENEHHTPFEKSTLHFLIDTDIATHIHFLKHRIGVSINAESARYKELKEDKYYIPEDWIMQKAETEALKLQDNADVTWADILARYTEVSNRLYHDCVNSLTTTLGRKRAKESARFFKSYNSQIQADVMFNFRSFAHFQVLRNSPDAQKEVRNVAQQMLHLVKSIPGNPFAHSIAAFGFDLPEFSSTPKNDK